MFKKEERKKKIRYRKKYRRKQIPNPDSVILSQIHDIVIAPETKRDVVINTCLTLQQNEGHSERY